MSFNFKISFLIAFVLTFLVVGAVFATPRTLNRTGDLIPIRPEFYGVGTTSASFIHGFINYGSSTAWSAYDGIQIGRTSTTSIRGNGAFSSFSGGIGSATTTVGPLLSIQGAGNLGSLIVESGVKAEYFTATSTTIASTFNLLTVGILQVTGFTLGDHTVTGDLFVNGCDINLGDGQATSTLSSCGAGGNLGIGTTTPWGLLAIEQIATGTENLPAFVVSDEGTSSPSFIVLNRGNVGIGIENPASALEIGSGQIFIPDGSRSAPSISFNSDTDTGMFRRGAGGINFSADATDVVEIVTNGIRLTSNGGLSWLPQTTFGVGPDLVLDRGAANRLDLAAGDSFIVVSGTAGSLGVATTSPYGLVSIDFPAMVDADTPVFVIGDEGTSSPALLVDYQGFVGIGTSSPAVPLEVLGDFRVGEGNNFDTLFVDATNGRVGIGNQSPNELLDIGNVLKSPVTPVAGDNFIQITSDSNSKSGIKLRDGDAQFGYTIVYDAPSGLDFLMHSGDTTGVSALFIERTTNDIGISTTSPGVRLAVDGSITFDGFTGMATGTLSSLIATSTLESRGVALFADGTVKAPSISLINDPDTGLYSPGANRLGFATGGIGRWEVDAEGRWKPIVDATYDIGDGSFRPRDIVLSRTLYTGNGTAGTPGYTFGADNNIGMFRAAEDNLAFSTAGSERLRIDSSGNVGISSTTPRAALAIEGNSSSTPALLIRTETTGPAFSLNQKGTGPAIKIDSGVILVPNGDGTNPAYAFSDQTGMGMYRLSANQWIFNIGIGKMHLTNAELRLGADIKLGWVNQNDASGGGPDVQLSRGGANILTLASGDSFGIGSTSPSRLLSVDGDAYISSNLFVGGAILATSTVDIEGFLTVSEIGFDADNNINFTQDNVIDFDISGITHVKFDGDSFDFNVTGIDMDFTIDSNNTADLFFVNGGTDRVGIASNTPGGVFAVNGGTVLGGVLDVTGVTNFQGDVRTEGFLKVNEIGFDSDNNINFSADNQFIFDIGGVSGNVLWDADSFDFNVTGGNFDFTIDSNTIADIFFVNGGSDRIGIGGTTTPGALLSVQGLGLFGSITAEGQFRAGGITATSTLNIPFGTAPTLSSIGRIALDTDSNNLVLATSTDSTSVVFASATTTLYGFNKASTSPEFILGTFEDLPSIPLKQVLVAVICKVRGGTSKVINFSDDGTNDTNSITCTTASTQYAITKNSTFNAYEDIRIEYGATTGAVDRLIINLMGYKITD